MDEIKKMLRAVINGQSAIKSELLGEIKKIDKMFTGRIDTLDAKVDTNFKKLNERLDKIGHSVAFLEDDAPTAKDFDELSSRVDTLEHKYTTL